MAKKDAHADGAASCLCSVLLPLDTSTLLLQGIVTKIISNSDLKFSMDTTSFFLCCASLITNSAVLNPSFFSTCEILCFGFSL